MLVAVFWLQADTSCIVTGAEADVIIAAA
jgi:hypothetical protein